uniref:PBZ-type domain-containing protein n=1 Tax=Anopheles maculatus TaxID=74869 RepID=A0A182SZJ4_9DIPT
MKTLVIIDTTKQTRKTVPEHTQEIGRGKFLECEDKRVSRTHGRITKECKGSKLLLRLESLHINSIFCRKKDGTTDYVLKKDETILLEASGEEPSTSSQSLSTNHSADHEKPMSQDNTTTDAEPAAPVEIKPDPDTVPTSIPHVQIKPDPDAGECNTGSGAANDPGPSGGSMADNSPPVSVKPDPDGMGGKIGLGIMGPAVAVLRPSCDFGIRCYRAGQDHRSAFAHPGDLDYRRPNLPPPPPGTPMCPFGARCYRRNPEHFREYDHPDPNAVLPRTPRHNGASRRQAYCDTLSDEEYPYESEPDFDDTSSEEYFPGAGEDGDSDDGHDSGLDC